MFRCIFSCITELLLFFPQSAFIIFHPCRLSYGKLLLHFVGFGGVGSGR